MKKERLKKESEVVAPVVQESVVPTISTTENLSTFLKTLSETKKKQKEELREKSIVVLPKLGDFFSLLSETKKHADTIVDEVKAVEPVNETVSVQVDEKKEEVLEIVNELKSTIETLEQKQEEIEQTIDDSEDDLKTQLEGVQKAIKALEKKLDREIASLQKMSRQVMIGGSGGGGEVRFEKLDDVKITSPNDGDAIIYNSVTNRYTNVPIRLSGGTTQQVLVKLSEDDYDYEWQDMIISAPVYTKLIDDATTPTVTFIGEAIPGSVDSAPVWRIQKIQFDSSGNVDSVKFASNSFDQIWLNRTSLTYS